MRTRGPIWKTCEVCPTRFRCEAARAETARFCSMACTREARRTGLIRCSRRSYLGRPIRVWTEAEEQELRDRYGADGSKVLAARFGTTRRAVIEKARRLGLQRAGGRRWSEREDEWLRANLTALSFRDLAARLERSAIAVQVRAKLLGLRRCVDTGQLTVDTLAALLGVHRETVARWIHDGRLEATQLDVPSGRGIYSIAPWDVRWFLRENPGAVDLRKVRQELFLELVLGDLGPRKEVADLAGALERSA